MAGPRRSARTSPGGRTNGHPHPTNRDLPAVIVLKQRSFDTRWVNALIYDTSDAEQVERVS
jgi:hypothetical protein